MNEPDSTLPQLNPSPPLKPVERNLPPTPPNYSPDPLPPLFSEIRGIICECSSITSGSGASSAAARAASAPVDAIAATEHVSETDGFTSFPCGQRSRTDQSSRALSTGKRALKSISGAPLQNTPSRGITKTIFKEAGRRSKSPCTASKESRAPLFEVIPTLTGRMLDRAGTRRQPNKFLRYFGENVGELISEGGERRTIVLNARSETNPRMSKDMLCVASPKREETVLFLLFSEKQKHVQLPGEKFELDDTGNRMIQLLQEEMGPASRKRAGRPEFRCVNLNLDRKGQFTLTKEHLQVTQTACLRNHLALCVRTSLRPKTFKCYVSNNFWLETIRKASLLRAVCQDLERGEASCIHQQLCQKYPSNLDHVDSYVATTDYM